MRVRRLVLAFTLTLAASLGLGAKSVNAETVVRYGISMADIPLTTGQPDRGAGAYQFTAYTICLLYTSPSPRDMRRSRMPSSA